MLQTRSMLYPSGWRELFRNCMAKSTTPKRAMNEKKISSVRRKFWRFRFQISRSRWRVIAKRLP
jgi:hypothetical protein